MATGDINNTLSVAGGYCCGQSVTIFGWWKVIMEWNGSDCGSGSEGHNYFNNSINTICYN